MLSFFQFGVGCHVDKAVKLVRSFHFHRSTPLRAEHNLVIGDVLISP